MAGSSSEGGGAGVVVTGEAEMMKDLLGACETLDIGYIMYDMYDFLKVLF